MRHVWDAEGFVAFHRSVDDKKFVAGSDIDPVYFDSPYFVYPDGPIAVEALRVIGAAMAQAGDRCPFPNRGASTK
jgi:non-homologous end joining protein Ku